MGEELGMRKESSVGDELGSFVVACRWRHWDRRPSGQKMQSASAPGDGTDMVMLVDRECDTLS